MREVMNSLVDPVAPTGRADFAVDITEPYPIPIICELLGAPKEDWQLFSRLATDILEIFSADLNDKTRPIITAAQDELDEYTRDLIAERRTQPADDLLTDLIAAEEAGDRLSTDELVMMVEAVIVGGTDTTRNQLGCAVALFAEHPDQWALLAEQPELAQRAVEESMRYFGAVRGTARFASEDIEYRDILFPKGTYHAVDGSPRRTAIPTCSRRRARSTSPSFRPTAAAHVRLRHPLLPRRRARPRRAARGAADPRPPDAEPGARRRRHVEADSVGIFGPERLPVTFRV